MSFQFSQSQRPSSFTSPFLGKGPSSLSINRAGDRWEKEADRVAGAVVNGGPAIGTSNFSFTHMPVTGIQREDGTGSKPSAPEPDEEKYKKAALKVGEAALQTEAGKKLLEKVENDKLVKEGKKFFDTTAGKIIVGTIAAGGAAGLVGGLAAAKKPLPFQLPDIPVTDTIKLGINIEGPLNQPTSGMLTITFSETGSKSAGKKSGSELSRETAELRKSLEMFKPKPKEQTKLEEVQSPVQRKQAGPEPIEAEPDQIAGALKSSGIPLDRDTREFMESRFSHDFSHVRIHNDAPAAESAQELNALAYTVGSDVVFAAGQYEPRSAAGAHLLAHELTHVIQQEGVHQKQAPEIGSPHTIHEREADAASLKIVTQQPASVETHAPHPIIQRTLKGALISGLTGLAGGAILGGMAAGPIGALVGGVIGLIGGAIVGEGASTRKRKLSGTEKAQAKTIFAESIDYSQVEITRDSLLSTGAPRTIGNTIHLKSDWGHFKGDTLDLTTERSPQRPNAPSGMETLIHEMTHVWQYQNGGIAYMPLSLIAQIKAAVTTGDRNTAYDWHRAHDAHLPWAEWNPEQQAEMVEDYNSALQRIKAEKGTAEDYNTVSIARPYIEGFVQKKAGAPTFGFGAPAAGSSGQVNT